ncbi:hypothetical protein EG856_01865 [Mycoplasmopsis phocirhinis]|uniref:Lipoprotein n=1 Tax=Mycoplasmopsis phocirhinis TaxID=142650 RepID=A0A4P6MNR2_9BACT|nr:hypothetical protein [Mycoplasmopsis phocirhinis]QBF34663.1 hypothetical protein EG856_01865 [Mycoplasmopsis phocirhinis]
MNKKLILSLATVSIISPISVVSCSNPFKDSQAIKNAKFQFEHNNIFKNKSFAQFQSQYLNKLYPQDSEQQKQDYIHVSNVFRQFFNNLDNILFFDSQLFHQKYILLGNELNNTYTANAKDGKKETKFVSLTKQSLIALMEYMYANTPYSYNVLNKVWDNTLYRDINKLENKIEFKFENSPANPQINNISIIPNEVYEMFKSNEFRLSPNLETFKLAYRKIIDTYQVLINNISEQEQVIQKALAPIYYVLQNPTPERYINENYASDVSGKYALIKPDAFKFLGQSSQRIIEFASDPDAYYAKLNAQNYINEAFNKADTKFKQTFDLAIQAWKQGIGKYGFAQLIAFSLYLNNPTNIQILAFNKANTKTYLIEYTFGQNKYLFDPIADYQNQDKTSLTIYSNKQQLQQQGYTLSEDTLSALNVESVWK